MKDVLKAIKYKPFIFYCVLGIMLVLLSACGSGGGGGDESTNTSARPGTLSFSLNFEEPYENITSGFHAALSSRDVCEDYDIETIDAYIIDAAGRRVAQGSWPCAAHQGKIDNVPAGTSIILDVYGTNVTRNGHWNGKRSNLTVFAGGETSIGKVTMNWVPGKIDPPRVDSTNPGGGDRDYAVDDVITVKFSKDLVPDSVENVEFEAFTLKTDTSTIEGDVTYNTDTQVATFRPTNELSYCTTYTATVTDDVYDRTDQEMRDPFSWSFTTLPDDTIPDSRWYKDSDGDGYSDGTEEIACNRPGADYYLATELTSTSGDCNDADALVNSGASEVCDNKNNDCDPGTADGSAEAWLGAACDGADSDLCNEGTLSCSAGQQRCSDETADNIEICDGQDDDCDGTVDEDLTRQTTCGVGACAGNTGIETCIGGIWGDNTCNPISGATAEICDGQDNDCNLSTPDGSAEAWLGAACDGADNDLCNEGTLSCSAGQQRCSDNTPDNIEICDGQDNDCNPATADGSAETWLGAACDGTDSDLCEEGTFSCSNSAQTCSDNTPDNIEICDGQDNDCNPATADGSAETWLGAACDGTDSDLCEEGTFSCSNSAQTCSDNTPDNIEICDGQDNDCNPATADGSAETWLGAACDGTDSDLCEEGTFSCSNSAQTCSDNTPDNIEICDGQDNDCNPATADGSAETWLGAACDGTDSDLCEEGTFSCSNSAQTCSDNTPDNIEICDGQDNDCNPATADGSAETWLGAACDGTDSDLCEEGTFSCSNSAQTCSDNTPDNIEICDGQDNDCNPATADGSAETWLGAACDGTDSDLCEEGTFSCSNSAQTCSDNTPDNIEICDGQDNDCNPATADGSAETWLGAACDGTDSDLCEEGTFSCSNSAQTCSDNTPDNIEICDGQDNDCNPATADGSAETWFGAACDGADSDLCEEGTFSCSNSAQTCSDNTPDNIEICDGQDNDCNPATADGSAETWLGAACDGPDSDLCEEGTFSCSNSAQTCSDNTPDNIEICDGQDNDCNPATADGSAETWFGAACDGADSDLCEEGTFSCSNSAQTCSDNTPDNIEICDGQDNDCDGVPDEDLGTTTCGTGTCAQTVEACVDGVPQDCELGTNLPPELQPIESFEVGAGGEILFDVFACDTNEADILTLSADLSDLPPAEPTGPTFTDNRDRSGTFSWTPGAGDFPAKVSELTFLYGHFGGNLNIEINDDFRNIQNFNEINNVEIGGMIVSVNSVQVTILPGSSAEIASFAIGGQELWIDDVCWENGCVDFENLAVGIAYSVGESFLDSNTNVLVESFGTSSGFPRVDNRQNAGGSGNDIQCNSINLNFLFPYTVSFTVTDDGQPPLSDTMEISFTWLP